MALNKESLLEFMQKELGVDTTDADGDSPLFSSGMIDSAGMVNLILFVETQGQVRFSADDVTLDHLDSIDRILRFVAERRDP